MMKKAYHKPAVRSENALMGVYGQEYGGETLGPYCAIVSGQVCNPDTNCEFRDP